MRKRSLVKIVSLILCLVMAAALFACGAEEDNRSNIVKPDISKALNDYEQLNIKRSNFAASFSFSLFRNLLDKQTNKRELVPASITERLSLDRIVNGDKIYMDGDLRTSQIDEQIYNLYTALRNFVASMGNGPKYDPAEDDIATYLNGTTHFDMRLGYADGCYNLKASYEDGSTDPQSFWGATDDENVDKLISLLNLDLDVTLSDYLMTSGLMDLTNASEWISGDAASKYFSTVSNKFIYNLTADSDKLYALIFSYVDKLAEAFGAEEYAEDLQKFHRVLPYLKKWVSVGPSSVDATVTSSGLPDKMTTAMRVNVNINLTELDEVLYILFPKDKKDLMVMVNFAVVFLSLRGVNGEENTLGIAFDLLLEENFLYGAENCALDSVDADLFLPVSEENENRYVFLVKDEEQDEPQARD